MRIVCPNCAAEYTVDDDRIPSEGMKATCPKCMTSWAVQSNAPSQEIPLVQPETPMAPSAPSPVPPPAPTPSTPPPPKATPPTKPPLREEDFEEEYEEELVLNLLGLSIPIPDIPVIRLLAKPKKLIFLILIFAALGFSLRQAYFIHKTLIKKGMTWGEVDLPAIRLSDLLQADLPLMDTIEARGNYEDYLKVGLKALREDLYPSYINAELALRKAAKLKRRDALSRALLGEVYTKLYHYDSLQKKYPKQALVRIDRAFRLNSKLSDAYRARAELFLIEKEYAKAFESIIKANQLKTDEAQNMITQGRIQLTQGSTKGALKAFQSAVAKDLKLASAHYYLGMVLDKSANYSESQESFQRALELVPGHPPSWMALARVKIDRFNLVAEALALLKRNLKLHNDKLSPREKADVHYYLAKGLMRQGKREEALRMIEQGKKAYPQSVRLIVLEAEIKQLQDPKFNQESFVDTLVKEEMKNEDYYLFKGQMASKNQDYRQAITYFNKVVEGDPSNARAHYELGLNYEANLDPDQALASYQKSIEADSGFGDSFVRLASLKIDKGNMREAIKLLEKVNQRNDRIAAVHNLLGVIALKEGNLDQAKRKFQKAIEIDPRFPDAYRNLARNYLKKDNFKEAEINAKKAKTLDPKNQDTLILFGELYLKTGRFTQAMTTYEEILNANPKNIGALKGKAKAAMGEKDWKKADLNLDIALELSAEDPDLFILIGITKFNLLEYDDSLRAYQNAQRFRPKDPEILMRLGEVSIANKRLGESVTFLKDALKYKPDYYEAHVLIAEAYTQLNRQEDALRHLKEVLRLTKSQKAKSKVYFKMGDAVRSTSLDEAKAYYKKSLTFDKRNAQAYFNLGQIYEEEGRLTLALNYYNAAGKADRTFALPHRHLGFIYMEQHLNPQAIREFQLYLKLDPKAADKEEIKEQIYFLQQRQ